MKTEKLILVLGGVRSGKSDYAARLAGSFGPDVLFIATAEAGDDEMKERIAAHRANRPETWHTLEAPFNVGVAIDALPPSMRFDALLLDCVTLLVSNLLLANEGSTPQELESMVTAEIDDILRAGSRFRAPIVAVSNEIGMGVVPPYELGRVYRDLVGRANQHVARSADEVYFMVAGLPMPLKGAA